MSKGIRVLNSFSFFVLSVVSLVAVNQAFSQQVLTGVKEERRHEFLDAMFHATEAVGKADLSKAIGYINQAMILDESVGSLKLDEDDRELSYFLHFGKLQKIGLVKTNDSWNKSRILRLVGKQAEAIEQMKSAIASFDENICRFDFESIRAKFDLAEMYLDYNQESEAEAAFSTIRALLSQGAESINSIEWFRRQLALDAIELLQATNNGTASKEAWRELIDQAIDEVIKATPDPAKAEESAQRMIRFLDLKLDLKRATANQLDDQKKLFREKCIETAALLTAYHEMMSKSSSHDLTEVASSIGRYREMASSMSETGNGFSENWLVHAVEHGEYDLILSRAADYLRELQTESGQKEGDPYDRLRMQRNAWETAIVLKRIGEQYLSSILIQVLLQESEPELRTGGASDAWSKTFGELQTWKGQYYLSVKDDKRAAVHFLNALKSTRFQPCDAQIDALLGLSRASEFSTKACLQWAMRSIGQTNGAYNRSYAKVSIVLASLEPESNNAESQLRKALRAIEVLFGSSDSESPRSSPVRLFLASMVGNQVDRESEAIDLWLDVVKRQRNELHRRSLSLGESQYSSLSSTSRQGIWPQLLSLSAHSSYRALDVYREATMGNQVLERKARVLRNVVETKPQLKELIARQAEIDARLADLRNKGELSEGSLFRLMLEREAHDAEVNKILSIPLPEFEEQPECATETLPQNSVLFDFFDTPSVVYCFCVRNGQEPKLLVVGKHQEIEAALNAFAKSLKVNEWPYRETEELSELVWNPLRSFVLPNDHIILRPDGITARIPFSALPGKRSGGYLIEEHSISLWHPEFRPNSNNNAPDGQPSRNSSKLVLVGGIDYDTDVSIDSTMLAQDASSASTSTRGFRIGLKNKFGMLPGALAEVERIGELAKSSPGYEPINLKGKTASEASFRSQCESAELLHLATHGFSNAYLESTASDPNVRRSLESISANFKPDLVAGLALAGANRNVAKSQNSNNDGILSSLEVQTLSLDRCRLAVLSACDSGIGLSNPGEGIIGLQRSFHIAGADTVIASLWKVDDAATQTLMVEFYRNMLEKKQGKLEALRNAQLDMLNYYNPEKNSIDRSQPVEMKLVPKKDSKDSSTQGTASRSQRLPPKYWAAFQLSGDWR